LRWGPKILRALDDRPIPPSPPHPSLRVALLLMTKFDKSGKIACSSFYSFRVKIKEGDNMKKYGVVHVAYLHWDKFYLVGWLIKLLKLTIITKHRVEVGPKDFEGTRRPTNPPSPLRVALLLMIKFDKSGKIACSSFYSFRVKIKEEDNTKKYGV
jgi:hypothetical protein